MPVAARNTARIAIRLGPASKRQIERAAVLQNRSLTEFIKSTLTDAAKKIIAEHDRDAHVVLSDRDRDRFLSLLDSQEKPNRALKNALRFHANHVR